MMTKVFEQQHLPKQLIYLTMVESGVNPVARSWASAVGLWQFIKSTGRLYGLRSDFYFNWQLSGRAYLTAGKHTRPGGFRDRMVRLEQRDLHVYERQTERAVQARSARSE